MSVFKMTSHISLTALNILCLCITALNPEEVTWKNLDLEPKIVGGKTADIEMFPYAVQIFNLGALCGGSILSSWAVLTAAHCFSLNKNIKEMQVIAGARYTYDMTAAKHEVWYFRAHEDYDKEAPFACDIALVFTTLPLQFTKRIQKAVLVESDAWMKEGERRFTATGWGFMSYGGSVSDLGLMEAQLYFVPTEMCGTMHDGLRLTPDMFCLYGDGERDTCQGDSGGAILWHGLVVGVVSHGHGCAVKGKPGVYTNVYHFRRWIQDKMKASRKKYCSLKKPPMANRSDKIITRPLVFATVAVG